MARSSRSMATGVPPSTRCRTGPSSRVPRRSPRRSARARWYWCASTCCTSPDSTCARQPTATAAALEHGFEGIIAKRRGSPYREGRRSGDWLKLKAVQSGEFLIGGYTRGNGARAPLGALLLGYREGKALRYAGHVGSGLDEASIAALLERSAKLERPDSPFEERPPLHRPTTWLTPRLVAEVSYGEWTKAGALRAPVFLRLRDDIDPQSVRRRPDGRAAVGAAAQRGKGTVRG